jgi:ferredoxin
MTCTYEIKIAPDKCQGHGRCAIVSPALFDIDESERGIVRRSSIDEDDAELLSTARTAARRCPEQAITVARSG